LHGAAIAKELSIPAVIVPPNPGVTSALGCLLVDVQHDFSESYFAAADDADPAAIEAEFGKLEALALERLAHEGVASADIVLQRSIDMMYQGQWRSLAVAAPSPIGAMRDLTEAFHRSHEREYNFRRDEAPIGLFRLNLKAIGMVPKAELAAHAPTGATPQPTSRRPVWFDADVGVDTPVYERADLPAGFSLKGPAVVEQVDSTVVIPPGTTASVDKYLNIIIRVSE
jgi:N-methylhydantoinase A